MTLSFPNVSRCYDESHKCICFWGYDSAFEISFYVSEDALRAIGLQAGFSQHNALHVFDAQRERIQHAASNAYRRRRGSYYELTPADF